MISVTSIVIDIKIIPVSYADLEQHAHVSCNDGVLKGSSTVNVAP